MRPTTAIFSLILAIGVSAPVEHAHSQGGSAALPQGQLKGRIKSDFSEVRAGPGAVYLSRGRVYQGDLVDIRRRSDNGEWMEVVGGGVQGWVRSRYVELLGAGEQAKAMGSGTATGKDRRQNNYGYDDRGRRVGSDGRPVGSGEGTDGFDETTIEGDSLSDFGDDGPATVSIGVSLGAAQVRRNFASNISVVNNEVNNSLLQSATAAPTGYTLGLDFGWNAHKHFMVRSNFVATLLAELTIPANPDQNIDNPVPIKVQALNLSVDAIGRYDFGSGWIGLYTGPRYFQHAFRETNPLIFTSIDYVGAGFGAAAAFQAGPVDFGLSGGLFLPLSMSQGPAESGDVASSNGFEAQGHFAWSFQKDFAIVLLGYFTRVQVDYSGRSTHGDGFVTPGTVFTYTAAQETNSLVGGNLGLRWRL
ncbi:MAG: hypothetical protein ACE366_17435 [Bradymonadia bacterium]